MKRLLVILFVLLAACIKASAQDALYVVDGQVSNVDVKPADIVAISLPDSAAIVAKYGRYYKNGVTVIVTKKYAILLNQQKFIPFNKRYKEYLDQKHNDDSNLAYVLNNTILNMDKKSAVNALYELSPEDIKSVTFKKDSHFTTDATVIITTKE